MRLCKSWCRRIAERSLTLASIASFVQRAGSISAMALRKAGVAAFSEGLYLDLRQANSGVKIQGTVSRVHLLGFSRCDG